MSVSFIARRRSRPRWVIRFRQNRKAMVALVVLALLVLVSLLAPALAPHDPNAQELAARLQGPSGAHWLGTDGFGRDLLSRIMDGTRVTFEASLLALAVAVAIGVPTGLAAGYWGGVVDAVLSRVADAVLALPPLLLAIAITGVLGPGLTNAMIALGVVIGPRFFRITRSQASAVQGEAFIEAARADGSSGLRIVLRHILPNASGPLLVQASFSIGLIVSAEASLSFLGLGVQSPQSSLGSIIREAFTTVRQDAFALYPGCVVVVVLILCFFVVGDSLRDAIGRG